MIAAIARSELRMLVRNRLVAVCALLIPLMLGVVFLINVPRGGSPSFVAALQIAVMAGMGVYVTATTTLAARRQTLFLKRMRSGTATDGQIVTGLVLPIVLVNIAQVAIVLGALAFASGATPVHPWLIAVVVLAAEVMFAGFAFATAGVTNSPEHAQVTTLPLFFVVVGAPVLAALVPNDGLGWLVDLLPAAALPGLLDAAWSGGDLGRVPLLLGVTLAWAAVAIVVARSMFRWEPRR